ncbi:DUF7692 domain-containing protein [Salinibaculum salinum]|uniref:DUF7692 domain-containing protein n=1 Tax=Salinibaculum salinum TaxID=3131996 RepID=UPI0030EEC6FA
MGTSEPPRSVRVRTDDGNEWRYRAIERAARLYDCNRSDAIAYACEDVGQLADGIEEILQRDDLTVQQRREIASILDDTASVLSISCEASVSVEVES